MSVTILETLQNAEYNIDNVSKIGLEMLYMVKGQIHTATTLLEKGYGIYDDAESLLEQYGDVENVPEKE